MTREESRRPRLRAVTGRLAAVNAIFTGLTMVTGPILAHALGAEGRGLLAAILVPATLIPWLLDFGRSSYATREAAQRRNVGVLVGTLGLMSILVGLAGAAFAPLVASFIAQGRETVYTYLLVALALLPVSLLLLVLLAINNGLERWTAVMTARLIPPVLTLVGLILLLLADGLTVASAAMVTLGSGIVAILPLLRPLRAAQPLALDRRVAREATSFGAKAWLAVVAQVGTTRLDQLLMTRLVDAAELGLYVVAVNFAGISNIATAALSTALFPRVAAGDVALAARAVRATVTGTAVLGMALAVVAPVALPIVFGDEFEGSVQMAWILAAAMVPLAGTTVLSAALTGAGQPASTAKAQVIGLVITVPGLLVALPPLGGEGAALVALVAYTATFGYLVAAAARRIGGSTTSYLLVGREDVASLAAAARTWAERRGSR